MRAGNFHKVGFHTGILEKKPTPWVFRQENPLAHPDKEPEDTRELSQIRRRKYTRKLLQICYKGMPGKLSQPCYLLQSRECWMYLENAYTFILCYVILRTMRETLSVLSSIKCCEHLQSGKTTWGKTSRITRQLTEEG